MVHAAVRKLVFRSGGVAFSLDLCFIVEICEPIADLLDLSCSDPQAGIIGALNFRNTRVPAIDPALVYGLSPALACPARTALLLNSSEGNWALLVDRVEEISLADRFHPLLMPRLLQRMIGHSFSRIELFNKEPVICFEPGSLYGSVCLSV